MKFLLSTIFVLSLNTFSYPQLEWFRPLITEPDFFLPEYSITPCVYENTIIAPGKKKLYAITLNDGKKIWTLALSAEIGAQPAIFQNNLLISTLDGKVYIINPENGKIKKEVTIINSSITSSFVFYQNLAIFKTNFDEVIALNLETGNVSWSYRRKTRSEIKINLLSSPILHENVVYSGFLDGALVALDAETGTEKWSIKLNEAKKFEGIYAGPVIYKGNVIVPKYDRGLYLISLSERKLIWAREDDGYQWCKVYEDSLLCATISGNLMKINPVSGNSFWRINFLKQVPSFPVKKLLTIAEPAFKDNMLYLSSDRFIFGIDMKKEKIIWRFKPKGVLFRPGFSAPPVVTNSNLLVVSDSGVIYNFILK